MRQEGMPKGPNSIISVPKRGPIQPQVDTKTKANVDEQVEDTGQQAKKTIDEGKE